MVTATWPRFACPECGGALAAGPADAGRDGGAPAAALVCAACRERFERLDDVWRFLSPCRRAAAARVIDQYRVVRGHDGYRAGAAGFYRRLPDTAPDHPHAAHWRVRRESFEHLRDRVLPRTAGPKSCASRVLDLGAGCGWLSHRLASLGHRCVAVDWLDDAEDGLGACRYYEPPIVAVQADFDALPFLPGQFDLVVFNASLHYAPDVSATLARARTMLAPGGVLVVMDSPMFAHDQDGHLMVADKLRRFRVEYGLGEVVHPSVGFLTSSWLARLARDLGMRGEFLPTRGSVGWRLRRAVGAIRLRRAPAAFGLWVAR